MDDELKSLVDSLYSTILQTSNKILSNCKKFNIEILQLEDPSYDEIAEQLTEVVEILHIISGDFPYDAETFHIATKAKEYTQNIIDIAREIRRGNEEALKVHISNFDRRPFV